MDTVNRGMLPRRDIPNLPYGGEGEEYKKFVETYGPLDCNPTNPPAGCNLPGGVGVICEAELKSDKVKKLANFAVESYNKKNKGKNFRLVEIRHGSSWVADGFYYEFNLYVVDDDGNRSLASTTVHNCPLRCVPELICFSLIEFYHYHVVCGDYYHDSAAGPYRLCLYAENGKAPLPMDAPPQKHVDVDALFLSPVDFPPLLGNGNGKVPPAMDFSPLLRKAKETPAMDAPPTHAYVNYCGKQEEKDKGLFCKSNKEQSEELHKTDHELHLLLHKMIKKHELDLDSLFTTAK